MNYIGYMLALLSGCTILYALYILLIKEYWLRNRSAPTMVLPYVSPSTTEQVSENVLKGNAFEKFVVTRFDKNYFRFLDWRSDKSHNGRFPISNSAPDMVFEYCHRDKSIPFAIECKWRAAFVDNAIQWATLKQIANYFAYQQQHHLKVFVVIGIGGSPEQPEKLFVVPLNAIQPDRKSVV